MKAQPPLARVLPQDAALALQRASQVRNTILDRFARAKAIDHAIDSARLKYPHLFRHTPIKDL